MYNYLGVRNVESTEENGTDKKCLVRQDLHNIMHMRKSHLSLCVFVCLFFVCLVYF